MRQYRIGEELIHVTVGAPEWQQSSVAGRINRWKKVDDRFLRVTCRDEPEWILVISAVFKRRGPGEERKR